MFGPRITLFTFRGVAVEIDLSWILIGAMVAWSIKNGPLSATEPPLDDGARWVVGVAGALTLLASVVLHELGHALAAQHYGIATHRITLFLFGGVASLDHEPETPRRELVIALAGPVVSGLLALVGGIGTRVLDGGELPAVAAVFAYLSWLNTSLVVFNLLPAFPLDGGRVLRAALWALGRSHESATLVAARLGAGLGALLGGGGLALFLFWGMGSGLWLVVLGIILRQAAIGAPRAEVADRALRATPLRALTRPGVVAVPAALPLSRFVDEVVLRAHHRVYPVVDGDAEVEAAARGEAVALRGVVSVRALSSKKTADWARTPVSAIMAAPSEKTVISVDASAHDALATMDEHRVQRLVLVDGDAVAGMITLRDLTFVLPLLDRESVPV